MCNFNKIFLPIVGKVFVRLGMYGYERVGISTKSHKHLPYHGQKYFAKIAHGELFVISVTAKYMHGELLSEISWV